MKDQLRIILLGDKQCGKSSIINTINTNEFVETVPSVVREVVIPPEYTMSQISLVLNDSSLDDENENNLQKNLLLADVFVIVVDCSVKNIFDSVSGKWIPLIQQANSTAPIIIAANKFDLIEGEEHTSERSAVEEELSQLLEAFDTIEVCLKCSALEKKNLDKILYYAEKSVVFPLTPLFDRSKQTLRPIVQAILRRIFRIINHSHTLLLSDEELNDFQHMCFGSTMSSQEINNLKGMLQKHGGNDFVDEISSCITEKGFIFLMQIFVMKDHTETLWMTLQKFNYDASFQYIGCVPEIEVKANQSVELTSESRVFLTMLFKMYDVNKTGVLTKQAIDSIFSTLENHQPLWNDLLIEEPFFMKPGCPDNCYSNEDNNLTLTGWISEWSLMMHLAPQRTVNTIIALGYNDDPTLLYSITRPKEYDWEKYQILRRNVVHAFLFGEKAVGKSSLLQRLLRSPSSSTYAPSMQVTTMIAPVKPRSQKSEEKLLILSEIPCSCVDDVLSNHMQSCDIACLMYDVNKPESFHYATELQKQLPDDMKVLYIANKSDLLHGAYETTSLCTEAAEFLNEYELELPLLTHKTMKDRLFPVVFDCAVYPDICVPKKKEEKKESKWLLKLSLVTIALGLLAGGVYLLRRKH